MKRSEVIRIGLLFLPLLLIAGVAIWVATQYGPELGCVVGLVCFVMFGGIESAGVGFFALFQTFAESDRRKAAECDRRRKHPPSDAESAEPQGPHS